MQEWAYLFVNESNTSIQIPDFLQKESLLRIDHRMLIIWRREANAPVDNKTQKLYVQKYSMILYIR